MVAGRQLADGFVDTLVVMSRLFGSLARNLLAPRAFSSMSDEQEIIVSGKAPLVRPWTDEDDARLLQMVEQKRHRALIAASLRRTRRGVTGRLRVLRRRQRIDPA